MTDLDFSSITELPGNHASAEQLSMIHTRYRLAADLCAGMDVLEAACGPGRALGFLSRSVKSIVGGDLTQSLVDDANRHYRGVIKVVQMDAQAMPWPDRSFDAVILYEALYYLPCAEAFLAEAKRVLRPGGLLLICSPNREWKEFNPSPFSKKYYSASELKLFLDRGGFDSRILAGFRVANDTWGGKFVASVRRAAVMMGLVPKTMKGKAFFKRLFYGRLAVLGAEIDVAAPIGQLCPVDHGPVENFKVIYAIATLR